MSCHVDDVFHFDGEPQRCFYCLDPLRLRTVHDYTGPHPAAPLLECAGCGLLYESALLDRYGTERILTQPDRYHISRLDGSLPAVTIIDLDHARSVLAERGDDL